MSKEPVNQNLKPEESKLVKDTDYIIRKWHTYDNYKCAHCDYETLYFFKMHEHYDLEDVHNHVWSADANEPAEKPAIEETRKLTY